MIATLFIPSTDPLTGATRPAGLQCIHVTVCTCEAAWLHAQDGLLNTDWPRALMTTSQAEVVTVDQAVHKYHMRMMESVASTYSETSKNMSQWQKVRRAAGLSSYTYTQRMMLPAERVLPCLRGENCRHVLAFYCSITGSIKLC